MTDRIEVAAVSGRSPHNEGLYEAGKDLLIGSVRVGREFCGSMISVTTGAIPVYIGLVGFIVGGGFRPSFGQGVILTLAPVAFLLAAVAFALGYFPKMSTFSLDIPAEIDHALRATMNKRMLWSAIGFALFALGVVLAGVGIFYGLSLQVPGGAR